MKGTPALSHFFARVLGVVGLIGVSRVDHVEVGNVVTLGIVDKEVMDGVLVRGSRTL